MPRALLIDPGLNKLQDFLLAMEPGDEVSVARAQAISGLNEAFCEAVLGALMRAGLMIRLQHNAYVRCRVDDQTSLNEPASAKAPASIRERLSKT
jgi:hypothetical protein